MLGIYLEPHGVGAEPSVTLAGPIPRAVEFLTTDIRDKRIARGLRRVRWACGICTEARDVDGVATCWTARTDPGDPVRAACAKICTSHFTASMNSLQILKKVHKSHSQ